MGLASTKEGVQGLLELCETSSYKTTRGKKKESTVEILILLEGTTLPLTGCGNLAQATKCTCAFKLVSVCSSLEGGA